MKGWQDIKAKIEAEIFFFYFHSCDKLQFLNWRESVFFFMTFFFLVKELKKNPFKAKFLEE